MVFILFFGFSAYSQISSDNSDFSEVTEFADSISIYVFCTGDENGGSLVAKDSTENGGYTFEWYKFDYTDTTFSISLSGSIEEDSITSTITGLSNGGYKAVLTKADTTQIYFAWVYNNVGRTVEIQMDPLNYCDYLGMQTEPNYSTGREFDTDLIYFDVETGESYTFKNKITSYQWSSNPEEDDFKTFGPFASIVEGPDDNESELPTENTTFSVIVTDKFGCVIEDEIEYTAIETDADLSWTTIDYKTGEVITANGSSTKGIDEVAPVVAQFTNESKNGVSYKWFFGDETRKDDQDSLITSDISDIAEHTYYYTNPDSSKTYTLKLYSESEHGCLDSILFNINVKPVKLEFPNVFTPNNGDDVNNLFILTEDKYQSIRNFKITIFNRAGQVVHEYDGDIYDWEGWNGTVKNSNREAPQGTYFFVFEVKGWDNKDYDNKNISKLSRGTGDDQAKETKFGIIRLYR